MLYSLFCLLNLKSDWETQNHGGRSAPCPGPEGGEPAARGGRQGRTQENPRGTPLQGNRRAKELQDWHGLLIPVR